VASEKSGRAKGEERAWHGVVKSEERMRNKETPKRSVRGHSTSGKQLLEYRLVPDRGKRNERRKKAVRTNDGTKSSVVLGAPNPSLTPRTLLSGSPAPQALLSKSPPPHVL
jgi:hypothetical protein